jgi:CRISPR/Cas system CSM-associated protein Csm2 small subunit
MSYTPSRKIAKVAAYADRYEQEIKKEAVTGIEIALGALMVYGIATMVNMAVTGIKNSSASISQVKEKLEYMIKLIDDQEKDGFGQFAGVFNSFRTNAKKVNSLIDEMIQPPSNNQDLSQVQKMQEFVQAAQAVLIESNAVVGALDEMQTWTSQIGNFLHGAGLSFFWDMTRYHAFSNAMQQIGGSLSLLLSKVETILKQGFEAAKQADAQAQAATPETEVATATGEPPSAGMADVQL